MIIPEEIKQKLKANGLANAEKITKGHEPEDFCPVAKMFFPGSGAKWLLTEISPENDDIAFGLCDLGFGSPELGDVYLPEFDELEKELGFGVVVDESFTTDKPLSYFVEAAQKAQEIIF